jgi:LysM repeat protein
MNKGYQFFLDGVLFPVAPSEMETKINNLNTTVALINEGEVNKLKSPGLTEFSFDLLLPNTRYPFAQYEGGFKSPSYYLEKLEKLKTSLDPFVLTVSRTMKNKILFDTSMNVAIEDYSISESADEGQDAIVSIALKQYRSYGTKKIKIKEPPKENGRPKAVQEKIPRPVSKNAPSKKADRIYTVASGDSLWNIAKKYYGDGSQYNKIYNANKDKISSPSLIYPGQVLVIPT